MINPTHRYFKAEFHDPRLSVKCLKRTQALQDELKDKLNQVFKDSKRPQEFFHKEKIQFTATEILLDEEDDEELFDQSPIETLHHIDSIEITNSPELFIENSPIDDTLIQTPLFTPEKKEKNIKNKDNESLSFLMRISHLIYKIIQCIFRKIYNFFIHSQRHSLYHQKKPAEIKHLFARNLDYETMRDQILSYTVVNKKHKKSELFFSNYNHNSYLALKNQKFSISKLKDDNEKNEVLISIATYEKIVDLYVSRFLKAHSEMNTGSFLPTLRFVALGIAIKISFDEAICNSDFVAYLPKDLNLNTYFKMELTFLKEIQWNISTKEIEQMLPINLLA